MIQTQGSNHLSVLGAAQFPVSALWTREHRLHAPHKSECHVHAGGGAAGEKWAHRSGRKPRHFQDHVPDLAVRVPATGLVGQ